MSVCVCVCVCACACACVCVCVCVCVLCFRDLQIVAFLQSIHLVYSLSFQSIFNDFAVPVCLLLLIVVILYFICLYIVHPV